MKIKCLSGFFIFEETALGEMGRFASIFELDLAPWRGNLFTFEALKDAPLYAIEGNTYLGEIVSTTYEGEPWEIFDKNNLVYNFTINKVVNKSTITQPVDIKTGLYSYSTNGLILPSSIMDDGRRVKDYSAWYSFGYNQFKYSEVTLV